MTFYAVSVYSFLTKAVILLSEEISVNPLMHNVQWKVIHTQTNLQKNNGIFCYHGDIILYLHVVIKGKRSFCYND